MTSPASCDELYTQTSAVFLQGIMFFWKAAACWHCWDEPVDDHGGEASVAGSGPSVLEGSCRFGTGGAASSLREEQRCWVGVSWQGGRTTPPPFHFSHGADLGADRRWSRWELCQHCQMEPPGAPWGCQDMWNVPCLGFIPGFPCWVISSTRQVWTAQEEREQELQVQVKPAGILHFWPVLCALNMCLVLGRSWALHLPKVIYGIFSDSQGLVFILKSKRNVNNKICLFLLWEQWLHMEKAPGKEGQSCGRRSSTSLRSEEHFL